MFGLLLALLGCDGMGHAYKKKAGVWRYGKETVAVAKGETLIALNEWFAKTRNQAYYRAGRIPEADAASFALDDHYARDKTQAFWCDTYREGKEYFTVLHTRAFAIPGADPASFRALTGRYAADSRQGYYEGAPFPVRDPASFAPLERNFAHDKVSGYYMRGEIAGSHGPSFIGIDGVFSKDKDQVFFSTMDEGDGTKPRTPVTTQLPGSLPASFAAFPYDYGKDADHAYYQANALSDDPAAFQILDFGYAKTPGKVFYYGKPLPKADPASFAIFNPVTETATAQDKAATYKDDIRTPK